MCSSDTAVVLGIIALLFHFCTFPSVLALAPLTQEQSDVDSEWFQLLAGSIDSLEIENGGGNEEIVANIHRVCCTVIEPLIEKAYFACQESMFSIYFHQLASLSTTFFSQTPNSSTVKTYLYTFFSWVILEAKKTPRTNSESKSDLDILFSICSCTRIQLRRHRI